MLTGNGDGTFRSASSIAIQGDVVPSSFLTTPGESPVCQSFGDLSEPKGDPFGSPHPYPDRYGAVLITPANAE